VFIEAQAAKNKLLMLYQQMKDPASLPGMFVLDNLEYDWPIYYAEAAG